MTDITPQAPPETPILKQLDRERRYALKKDATVFSHPRGARVLTPPDGNQVKISIPTAIQTFWILPFFMIPLVLLVGTGFGIYMSIVPPGWTQQGYTEGYFNPLPLILSIIISLGLAWVIWRLCFPRIIIEANRDGVTVGKYKFDWRALGGFRIGHTAGGVERENTQWLYQGMVIEYGPYGFDLPYMVRKYYAAYYVVWLNDMLATIGQDDKTGTHDPKSGFKKSMF